MIGKVTHGLFRRRIKFFLYPIFIFSCIFIIYQFVIFGQLNQSNTRTEEVKTEEPIVNHISTVRGVHQNNWLFYEKREDNSFRCIHSMEIIQYDQVNDDYCDCLDGTDEPGTNACPNGEFYCKKQVSVRNFSMRLPSNRVNDGICDCCDGSDEWQNRIQNYLSVKQQKAISRFLAPCPVQC